MLWIKLCCYAVLFTGSWLSLFLVQHSFAGLIINYVVLGLTGMLLTFNAAHDAVHATFSDDKRVNGAIFSTVFNLQGFSAYLWRIRHLASHHVFPNVDGCDADIDDNPFIRLSPHHPRKPIHRYQHLYATVLYAVYTLQWLLYKDIHYLFKKDLANLRNQRHSIGAILQIILWKAGYFCYMLAIPLAVLPYPTAWILSAFLIMHLTMSICLVLVLIISHLCEETLFPLADETGALPFTFYMHQLAVSLDYHPRSIVANWLMGGFNAHAAHHLFPRLPHTAYPALTRVIQRVAKRHGYPYHELSMPRAILSHYRYLRQLGRPPQA
jgi:linoleoyl-CoA desaturase